MKAIKCLKYGDVENLINKGDKDLIYGAYRSIAKKAIQFVKYMSAHVNSVCSLKNFDLVNFSGSDKMID